VLGLGLALGLGLGCGLGLVADELAALKAQLAALQAEM